MSVLSWNRLVQVVTIAYVVLLVAGAVFFVSVGGLADMANWIRREVLFPMVL